MSLALPPALKARWENGLNHGFVGDARPTMQVRIRRVYLQRGRRLPNGDWGTIADEGQWTSKLVPTTDWLTLPSVSRVLIEQSLDSNGIATCTVELANVAYPEVMGVLGAYHAVDRGYLSPWRAYQDSSRPGMGPAPNRWGDIVATAAQIHVRQGYGDVMVDTFTGLLDSVAGGSTEGTMSLAARDFGQLLTDCRIFGWNKEPTTLPPIHFVGKKYVEDLENSGDPAVRKEGRNYREHAVICADLSDAVEQTLTWAGLPKHVVRRTGAPLNTLSKPIEFGQSAYLIDVITQAAQVTGYVFFVGEPTVDYPMGTPTFKRSKVASLPDPSAELRDDQLLTGLTWQRTDEPLAGIIRVRGKQATRARGGVGAGQDRTPRIMGVYRPPWHVEERDARLIRHVVHYENSYETLQECVAAAQMIALQEALASTTATIEIPAHPGLQLDDIVSIYDRATGLSTRAWIAQKQSTFIGGKNASWKQSLGVALVDTPDVVQVVADLHETLTDFTAPSPIVVAPGGDELPPNQAEGEGEL